MRCHATTTRLLLLTMALAAPLDALGASRQMIRIYNVSLQPLLVLTSAALQGKLRNRSDVIRCLRTGSIAGLAFYEAKRLAGGEHVPAGLAIANVASSATRNAAAGRHAFARIGFTLGPTRTEFSTPLENDPTARIHLQVSVAEVAAMAVMRSRSDEFIWRDGLIALRKLGRYEGDHRSFSGYTIGVFAGTSHRATPLTWHHETVHVIQSIQGDSVEPPLCAWRLRCHEESGRSMRWFEFQPVLGVFLTAAGGAMSRQDYTARWSEIEAHRLAENERPQ